MARALEVGTDVLLGVKPPKVERYGEDSESRRLWKRFQLMGRLPDKDRRAVVRLMNPLVAASGKPRLRAAG